MRIKSPSRSGSVVGDSLISTISNINLLSDEIRAITKDNIFFNEIDPEIQENRRELMRDLKDIKRNLSSDSKYLVYVIKELDKMIDSLKKIKYKKKKTKTKSKSKKRSKSKKSKK